MSKKFRDKFPSGKCTKKEMQAWCSRPGKRNPDGTNNYTTEQNHKAECDINQIIKKYDRTGLITHINKFEAEYGDLTGEDFTEMQNRIIAAQNQFMELPPEIRKEFKNEPANLLEFMEDPGNRERAIELGLINKDWHPDKDGLGEHITDPENTDRTTSNKTLPAKE